MDFGAIIEPVAKALEFIGLPAPLFGSSVAVGFLLRYARGTVARFGPGAALVTALVAGVIVTIIGGLETGWAVGAGYAKSGVAFIAAVLILEGVLHKASEKLSWIPGDNQWVKPAPADPPAKP